MRRFAPIAFCLVLLAWVVTAAPADGQADPVDPGPVPAATCGPGSHPETTTQGRVSAEDAAKGGFDCNLVELSHFGNSGGYKVHRYIDAQGHECAFYDSTLLFPTGVPASATNDGPGVYVLDMTDPAHPVKTDNLVTPAMLSPHESLYLNQARGLLVADMGYPTFNPGFVDIYDVTKDCQHPTLLSSSPLGILGHESGFSPDGMTFWATSTGGHTITALDLKDPTAPVPLWVGGQWSAHGVRVSKDGNRLYIADTSDGLHILDVSEIQSRQANPAVKEISFLTWPELSIPQVPIPVSIAGHPYLIEIDEFGNSGPVGAARVIDIADDTHPKVVANIRLAVHQPENRNGPQAADPGSDSALAGYTGHYCNVPKEDDPGILACGMILSGLRVFDIRDPLHPKELAYWNHPAEGTFPGDAPSSYAMDAPAFVPERGEIWHADGNGGFSVLRVLNGVWPFTDGVAAAGDGGVAGAAATGTGTGPAAAAPVAAPRGTLPATGPATWFGVGGLALLAGALVVRRVGRRA